MHPRKIVIDGKTYNSVNEMPEEVRLAYERAMKGVGELGQANIAGAMDDIKNIFADRNGNGTPDIFEGGQAVTIAGSTKFIVDGSTYDSLDELPPEARAKYDQAMGAMDANRNGMPDFLEGMMTSASPAKPASDFPAAAPRRASPTLESGTPAITPDTSNGWMLAFFALGLVVLCAVGAAGIWYFFLR